MDWPMWAAAATVVLAPGVLGCLFLRRVTAVRLAGGAAATASDARGPDLESLDQRVTRLANALSLLTDTAEAGLREAFAEIERLAKERRGPLAGPAALQHRIVQAAAAGHSPRAIAVAEGLAESEVLLRLGLAAREPEEAGHAAVR